MTQSTLRALFRESTIGLFKTELIKPRRPWGKWSFAQVHPVAQPVEDGLPVDRAFGAGFPPGAIGAPVGESGSLSRKRLAELDPGLRPALLALVKPDVRGDPMSPLRWRTKSTRQLAAELMRQGRRVSGDQVADLLRGGEVQPAGQRKDVGTRPASRPRAQFRYLNEQVLASASPRPRAQWYDPLTTF
ncbi:hypothetical protein AB0D10_06715 [Kitasatospora sp. NPDC048545]|uniref:ISAzo13-like element transposase-related protein n=1 Tax=Kitasatospora sp. NPDC048545 TaxID=3157208 RepID=UPI0033E64559